MTALRSFLLLALASAFSTTGGCSSEPSQESTPAPILQSSCEWDEECPGGLCMYEDIWSGNCTRACKSDEDCGGYYACGTRQGGDHACFYPCGSAQAAQLGFVCVDGRNVACSEISPTHPDFCAQCSCDNGKRCEAGQGCVPARPTGQPCDIDQDCLSRNCSSWAKVCREPLGESCNGSTCDDCVINGNKSFCLRECKTSEDCDGLSCYAGQCRLLCATPQDPFCGGSCILNSADNAVTCDCASCRHAPRSKGSACNDLHACDEGECIGGVCK